MPTIYISKELYDQLVRLGQEPGAFVIKAAEEKLGKDNGAKPVPKEG